MSVISDKWDQAKWDRFSSSSYKSRPYAEQKALFPSIVLEPVPDALTSHSATRAKSVSKVGSIKSVPLRSLACLVYSLSTASQESRYHSL